MWLVEADLTLLAQPSWAVPGLRYAQDGEADSRRLEKPRANTTLGDLPGETLGAPPRDGGVRDWSGGGVGNEGPHCRAVEILFRFTCLSNSPQHTADFSS